MSATDGGIDISGSLAFDDGTAVTNTATITVAAGGTLTVNDATISGGTVTTSVRST